MIDPWDRVYSLVMVVGGVLCLANTTGFATSLAVGGFVLALVIAVYSQKK